MDETQELAAIAGGTSIEVVSGSFLAGKDMDLSFSVACDPVCDLRGKELIIRNQEGAEVGRLEFAEFDGTRNTTGQSKIKAPLKTGGFAWTAIVPAHTDEGAQFAEASHQFRFNVKAHKAGINVWGAPPAIGSGEKFTVKVGIKCPEGCNLAGREFEPGDDWTGPHPGIPYVLKAGGGDVYYESVPRKDVTKKVVLSAHIGSDAARAFASRIQGVKGWAGGRFYVNEWREIFAPVASAGADQRVEAGSAVVLDASASTDKEDGSPVKFVWKQTAGETVVLGGASSAIANFTAPSIGTTLQFQVTVTDKDGGQGSVDSSVITVTAVAPAPQILGTPTSSPEGTTIALTSSPGDPGPANSFQYAWTVMREDVLIASGTEAAFSTIRSPRAAVPTGMSVAGVTDPALWVWAGNSTTGPPSIGSPTEGTGRVASSGTISAYAPGPGRSADSKPPADATSDTSRCQA